MLSYTDWKIERYDPEIDERLKKHGVPIPDDLIHTVTFGFDIDDPEPSVGWEGGLILYEVEVNGMSIDIQCVGSLLYDMFYEELEKALEQDRKEAEREYAEYLDELSKEFP